MIKAKWNSNENDKKNKAGFLYLFAALARRASQENDISELQRLSGLIEAEITELQNTKNPVRLRDVVKRRRKLQQIE